MSPARAPRRAKEPRALLETFPNPAPGRDYEIVHTAPEFTSLCPVTGQPDFATIVVRYVPDGRCVELKSLKLYFFAFRDRGIFYEAVVNRILDDLVAATAPRRMEVRGEFRVRGGISSVVTATFPFGGPRRRGEA
ncbi:MAG: NADPH-dependent 7-cyano-7-deazaguanine reductase QueF [Planctomycetes bacterium]|nr:NADPH-dependent 7-cyano-7-deazaguanine reductase QueF [Planctomycetota bacterium]